MGAIILDEIPFDIDVPGFLELLRLPADHKMASEVRELCAEALLIARPRAMYREAGIDTRSDDMVTIESIPFRSKLLSTNLRDAHTVYPFVLTCGMELEMWSNHFDDILRKFWADSIKGMALGAALKAFDEHLGRSAGAENLSAMNPGSLEDWPIEEQRVLFKLLGNVQEAIGVSLTESCMMVPIKSISGLRFISEEGFVNCQLCDREKCPGRRAPYDEHLKAEKYSCRDMDA